MGSTPHERWHDVNHVLDAALTLPLDERAAYLDRACAGDTQLRAAVDTLLAAAAGAATFLEGRAGVYAAPLIDADAGAGMAGVAWLRADDAHEGSVIGPYRIVRELARGGMGAVYLAERADGQFEQRVALKLIKRGIDSDAIRGRFLRERQILARLEHPAIARLADGGITDGGRPWFAMEYVEGTAITAYCEAHRLAVELRLDLFLQVCEAVRFAHANLVVHRDLKPSNILVTPEGWVKLLDFGVSKLLRVDDADAIDTDVGMRLMTPEYAAPEQVRGEPVTTATDVYALGAILYELLAGQRAHHLERRTAAEMERVICTIEPPAPSTVAPPGLRRELRGDLDTIVSTSLQKDPARRYASVEALSEDLRRYAAGLPVRARPDSRMYRAGKFVKRHRVGVGATAAVFLALAGGLAGTVWQARAASRAAARATREATKATEVKDFVVGLFQVSDPAESRGREITARELLARGTRRVDSALARQPEVREELLSVLAGIHSALGFFAQADTLAQRAVTLARATHGDGSPEIADRLTTWGATLWERGEYARAESVLTSALTIRRRMDDDTLVAHTLNALAAVYSSKGELERAVTLDREILALDRRHYGDDHLEVATDLNNLGIHLTDQGKWTGADSAIRAALDIRRRRLDADHPLTMIAQHNLAVVLAGRGELAEAERIERDVLARRRRLYPRGHPDVATALHQVAEYVSRQGRLEEADSILAVAVAIRRQWLGSDHPETMTSVNNRAVLNFLMGKLPEAEAAAREVLATWQLTLGPEHRHTTTALATLGVVLRDQRRFADAEPMLRQAVALRRRMFGDSHEEVAHALLHLGRLFRLVGGDRLVAGEAALRESVAIYRRQLPDGDPRIAPPLSNLGAVLTQMGRAAEGEPLIREALSIQERASDREDVTTGTIRRSLGMCLAALGRYQEAEAALLESYRVLAAAPYAARQLAETARELAAFYEGRGRRAEAERFRKLAAGAK